MDPVVLFALLAAAGLWALARWRRWKVPPWAYGVTAGFVALLGLARRKVPPVEPPRGPDVERVRITAADILARREAEAQGRIVEANAAPEREAEVASVLDGRRRR